MDFQSISYHTALAVLVLAVVSYYFGSLAKKYVISELVTSEAMSSIKFLTLPLILTSAIVLGLMLSVTRATFDKREALVEKFASDAIQVDRLLTFYGPEASKAQQEFREYMAYLLNNEMKVLHGAWDRTASEAFAKDIMALPTKGDKVMLKNYLVDKMGELSQIRFDLASYADRQIYTPTIVLITSWLCVIFFVCGTVAPLGNAFVMAFGLLSAASVASVMFLILEYQQPIAGLIQLNERPLELVRQELLNKD